MPKNARVGPLSHHHHEKEIDEAGACRRYCCDHDFLLHLHRHGWQWSPNGTQVVAHNHYLIAGLAPISTANTKELAGDAKDYSITVKHSFVDGLLNMLTSGIYSPTTVIVTK